MAVCALVAASDFNEEDFCARWKAGGFDYIIAIDAGFASLSRVGCQPDVVVGDFDSLGYVPEGVAVERHPVHKDKSDLELTLDLIAMRGFESVVIYGALGARLDHTIANLQMCARFAEEGIGVQLVGLDSVVTILVGPSELALPARQAGTVSVFSAVPMSHGVTEWGLEYPLENANLSNRTTLGLSNEFVGTEAVVSVESGTLYVFHPVG